MKKVYSAEHDYLIDHLKALLEDRHVACIVKNRCLSGGVGELPPNECWPELWINQDYQYDKAMAIVREVLAVAADGSVWACPGCEEVIEAQFTDCWNCGATQPES